MNTLKILILAAILWQLAIGNQPDMPESEIQVSAPDSILPAADQPALYLPMLQGKRVGLVVNQTAVLTSKGNQHLVDFLAKEGITIAKIFVPEHGFRGEADAGEIVNSEIDKQTGLPIVSLYGDNKKPSAATLSDVDVMVYDLQDVGVRFYTYISTLHYVMESCAANNKPLLIFDRPNPNGDYVDGPILNPKFKSFVGMHPIPVVHGLTVGELAHMINAEGWLEGKMRANIEVIPVKNWEHAMHYSLPIKPSPNLPNDVSIRLYPSLCYFEGTDVSLGRGTYYPFQVYGYPDPRFGDFSFTPVSIPGMSKTPPQQNKKCYGRDLRDTPIDHRFSLEYLLEAYHVSGKKEKFFNSFFDKLAGSDELRLAIIAGKTESQIRKIWEKDLDAYKIKRSKYLLYP